jgi:hypothetical protein
MRCNVPELIYATILRHTIASCSMSVANVTFAMLHRLLKEHKLCSNVTTVPKLVLDCVKTVYLAYIERPADETENTEAPTWHAGS